MEEKEKEELWVETTILSEGFAKRKWIMRNKKDET